jgi:hypothetical protein
MHDTRTAFRIYLVQNAINIVLAVVLVGPLGVEGLALAFSISYTAGAAIALVVVSRREGGLGGPELTTPVLRVLAATGVMAVATVFTVSLSGATSGFSLLLRVLSSVIVGVVSFAGATVAMAAWDERHNHEDTPYRRHGVGRHAPESPLPSGPPPGSHMGQPENESDGAFGDEEGSDGEDDDNAGGTVVVLPSSAPRRTSSVRLLPSRGADDQPDSDVFHGRLDEAPTHPPIRLLPPVAEDGVSASGSNPATRETDVDRPVSTRPTVDEEEPHGQDPGSYR